MSIADLLEKEIMNWFLQAANAISVLQYMRDVKIVNILIDKNGMLKVS